MKRLWLVRAGRHGEREQTALDKNVVAPGFERVPDLSKARDRDAIAHAIELAEPELKPKTVRHFAAQLNQFCNEMRAGDLVLMPRKFSPLVAIGVVTGTYRKDDSIGHCRPVDWKAVDVPREVFKSDLRFSLGAFMTVCEIKRNNALGRVEAIVAHRKDPGPINGNAAGSGQVASKDVGEPTAEEAALDLEDLAGQQVEALLKSEFTGNDLADLIGAILRVDGYFIRISPPGKDGGRDILAAEGSLGFSGHRLCVEVKSGAAPADSTAVLKLQGAMANVRASHGLLVSLNGVTLDAERILNDNFFQIRLWQMADVLKGIYRTYDRLPEELRTKLPLKQIWVPVAPETE